MENILNKLLRGDINKSQCCDEITNHFSDFWRLHNGLQEGDEIIYNGHKGTFLKQGDKKSRIKWKRSSSDSEYITDVYNITFFKTPLNYWQ